MNIKKLIIHHSAGPQTQTREDILRHHTKVNGWSDIGYHKLIMPHGNILQGRPDDKFGAHCIGHNRTSLGICVIGNFETLIPQRDQLEGLITCCHILCERYGLNPLQDIFYHGQLYPTACCGKHLINHLPSIRQKVFEHL